MTVTANAKPANVKPGARKMCLAIPGRIVETSVAGGARIARVEFGGIVRPVCLDFVPEAGVGDYVLVHVGFAISRVDRQEAERTYEALKAMDVLQPELLAGE
jgi:hydrogenase expression/formation protein HypC